MNKSNSGEVVRKVVTEEIDEASVLVNMWNEAILGGWYSDIKVKEVKDDGEVVFTAFDNTLFSTPMEVEREAGPSNFKDIDGVMDCDYIGGGNFRVTLVKDGGDRND